jgi:predicted hydrocarbon binding protein
MSAFKTERDQPNFAWADLGDLALGRPNLGPDAPVAVYRLLEFTLRDVLTARYGAKETSEIPRAAGRVAGRAFCANVLDAELDFDGFVAQLQQRMRELKMGILRIEKADVATLEFTVTLAEDLDCSGLPYSNEVVCDYDEGFIAGLFEQFTGRPFTVREVDCWASGGRVCRFEARPTDEEASK